MIDGIIKADGTSRLMRATLPATYEEFKAQAADGILPLDVLFNADGWIQFPTFLNKANLLKDSTAALFGFGSGAMPDSVLSYLGKYNQHWWKRRTKETIHSVEKSSTATSIVPFTMYLGSSVTVYYSDKATTDGTSVTLVNPVPLEFTSGNAQSVYTAILGKYVTNVGTSSTSAATTDKVYFVAEDATLTRYTSPSVWFNLADAYLCSVKTVVPTGEWEYVRSNDKNEYPDSGESGGYEYQYIGVPFQNAVTAPKIATGGYTGTGTSGASNPNSLIVGFKPEVVFVAGDTSVNVGGAMFFDGMTMTHGWGSSVFVSSIAFTDNGVSWYASSADQQLNKSGQKYRYCAIG